MLIAAVGCSGDAADKVGANATAGGDSVPMARFDTPVDSLGRPLGRVRREPTRTLNIVVEGQKQATPVELFEAPEDFPVRFSTYKPTVMQVAMAHIGSTATVTFSPVFGGQLDPDAFVQVQFDTTALAADDPAGLAIETILTESGASNLTTNELKDYDWATAAKSFRFRRAGRRITGTMIVGTRGDHSYRIFTEYPEEFGDGMGPRVSMLLRQWRWEDDYTYLLPDSIRH
jgi:hypothetical protein